MRIVVIEDDAALREVLRIALLSGGYEDVLFAKDGLEGYDLVVAKRPALVLLDVMLPKLDGYEVCRSIRANDRVGRVPIVMLTAKSEERDIVRGLDLGANDYITKPFSCPVLLARIRAALRTDAERNGGRLTCDGLELDRDAQVVRYRKERISLSPGEYRLLEVLMAHPGRIHTRMALLDMIQVEPRYVTDRTIDVMLSHMRPKLGAWAEHIETARGIGYRLVP